jgi:ribonuclease PH
MANDSTRLFVRMTKAWKQRVKREAKRRKVTMSRMIRDILNKSCFGG